MSYSPAENRSLVRQTPHQCNSCRKPPSNPCKKLLSNQCRKLLSNQCRKLLSNQYRRLFSKPVSAAAQQLRPAAFQQPKLAAFQQPDREAFQHSTPAARQRPVRELLSNRSQPQPHIRGRKDSRSSYRIQPKEGRNQLPNWRLVQICNNDLRTSAITWSIERRHNKIRHELCRR